MKKLFASILRSFYKIKNQWRRIRKKFDKSCIERKMDDILEQLEWLHKYHQAFTDITETKPVRGYMLLHQKVGVKLLEIFDLVCHEYELPYWLGAGNLLGVVRHNGQAIPWDDDIDVYMLRQDYEKAIRVLPQLFDNEKTDLGCLYRGWACNFMRYKTAPVTFDIFPIDQLPYQIETIGEWTKTIDKIHAAGLYSRSDWIRS